MPCRTCVYISLACASFILDGTPLRNSLKFPFEACSRILDADIPSTPSASGSRSPAECTAICLKSYKP